MQVLDEIGINFGEAVPEAPSGEAAQTENVTVSSSKQQPIASPAGMAGNEKTGKGPSQGGASSTDAAMSELEARLNLLKRE